MDVRKIRKGKHLTSWLQPPIKRGGGIKKPYEGTENKKINAGLKIREGDTLGKTEKGRGAVETGERWGEGAPFKDGSLQGPHRITLRKGEEVGDGTKTQEHHITRKGNMGDRTKISNDLI